MPFTVQELDNILNSTLAYYMDKGKVFKQNVQNKPMAKAFDDNSGTFPGGKSMVSIGVKSGQGGGTLQGYSHDDQVNYYNPASNKRVNYTWKEHHIGLGMTHTELKNDGITVEENNASQSTSEKSGREQFVLANLLEEKLNEFSEDYAKSWDTLIHGDGTADSKSLAGMRSLILDVSASGLTGGLGRGVNTWWRNRAATAANAAAGGTGAIVSNTANGGALIQYMQTESRQINRYASGTVKRMNFAGSSFIGALESEYRANGRYTDTGFNTSDALVPDMPTMSVLGSKIIYDPLLDDLGYAKRLYSIDMNAIKLLYMTGEKMKKANPARPYDRYVMYRGLTTTAVMVARQLNTSGVYDIA